MIAFKESDDTAHRLIYANILGMLGNNTGVPALVEHVRSTEWDEGWNFRGMGQFGGSISPLDSHIIALGKSGTAERLPVILEKVATLDADKEFSHHRSVALALEAHPDPSAAKPLADLLSQDNISLSSHK